MTRSEIVGANILKHRNALGMSQVDLADLIGRSQTMVSMYEKGQRLPSTQIIANIAKVLGVSFGELYSSADEKKSDEQFIDDPMPYDRLSKEERRLVELYRSADKNARVYAIQILENNPAEVKRNRA